MSAKAKKRLTGVAGYLALIFVCVLFAYPLVFLLANSLRPYMSTKPVLFFPDFNLETYKMALTMIPFFKYLINTIKLVVITVSFSLFFDFLYGYALARLKAPGKRFCFNLVLLQMMIPYIAIQIPQFVYYSQTGLMNTYWIWVLNGIAGNVGIIFLTKQFLAGFPKELEEAAQLDGCGRVAIIFKIFVPMSKPLLALIFFNNFVASWNDFMGPYMFMSGEKYPLATALFGNIYFLPGRPDVILEPVVFAACVMFSIPLIILFFFLQKFLVAGIATSGLKG